VEAADALLRGWEAALRRDRAAHAAAKAFAAEVNAAQPPGAVALDVGGQLFHTALSTLGAAPDSLLGVMASAAAWGFASEEGPDGALFLDRDPAHFALVLAYLRHGQNHVGELLTDGDAVGAALRRELWYYGLRAPAAPIVFDRLSGGAAYDSVGRRYTGGPIAAPSALGGGGRSTSGWRSGRHTLTLRLCTPCHALVLGASAAPDGVRLDVSSGTVTHHSREDGEECWPLAPWEALPAGGTLTLCFNLDKSTLTVLRDGRTLGPPVVLPAARPLIPYFSRLMPGEAFEME